MKNHDAKINSFFETTKFLSYFCEYSKIDVFLKKRIVIKGGIAYGARCLSEPRMLIHY